MPRKWDGDIKDTDTENQNLSLELVQTLNPVLKGSEPNYYDLKCKLNIIAI